MKENVEQINHLAEIIYNETKGIYVLSRGKAELIQDIVDEMQDMIDRIKNELLEVKE